LPGANGQHGTRIRTRLRSQPDVAGAELHGVERKIIYRKIAPRKPKQGAVLFQILIGKHHEISRGGMSNRFALRHLANRIFNALLARIVDVARAKGINKNTAKINISELPTIKLSTTS